MFGCLSVCRLRDDLLICAGCVPAFALRQLGSAPATSAVTTLSAGEAVAENGWTDDSLCRLCKTMESQETGASFRAEQ